MDPNQTWTDLIVALQQKQWSEAKELADALYEWIQNKGFPPITVGDESLGQEWHRTITTFVCLHVANKVDGIRQRRKRRNSPQKKGGE